MTTTDLEPVTGEIERISPLLPMAPGAARQAMAAYQELCAAVLEPHDWIGTPGEPESFVRRSGWDKLATFYGASVELLGETRLERNAEGELMRASARARATDPRTGRYRDGGGACGRNEKRFATPAGRAKIEHDLPASAETRATNRAIANLVGYGAVSAEEVDAGAGGPDLPPWARDIPDDAIARVGDYLATILRAGGHPEPEVKALEIGQAIFNVCGSFPDACARLARLLEQAVAPPAPADDVPWTEPGEPLEATHDDAARDAAATPPEFDGTDEAPAPPANTTDGETTA